MSERAQLGVFSQEVVKMKTKTNLASLGRGEVMNRGTRKKSFVLFLALLLVVVQRGVASQAFAGEILARKI